MICIKSRNIMALNSPFRRCLLVFSVVVGVMLEWYCCIVCCVGCSLSVVWLVVGTCWRCHPEFLFPPTHISKKYNTDTACTHIMYPYSSTGTISHCTQKCCQQGAKYHEQRPRHVTTVGSETVMIASWLSF